MKKSKVCNKCSKRKLISEYTRNERAKDKLNYNCRTCQNEITRISQKKARLKANQEINKLKDIPCADCGAKYPPYVMDFDHVKGKKKFKVSDRGNLNLKFVLREVEKCDVVCSNCHRVRTHNRGYYKREKEI